MNVDTSTLETYITSCVLMTFDMLTPETWTVFFIFVFLSGEWGGS